MLTGDKGKTAKMIGVQCGMLTPLERQLGNNKATRTEFEYQQDCESIENQEDGKIQKVNSDVRKIVRQKSHIFYEIDDEVADINLEIEKLMQIV